MTEIPKQREVKKPSKRLRSPRKVRFAPEPGTYSNDDAASYLYSSAIPTLAETLGAKQLTLRGLVGRYGVVERKATKSFGTVQTHYDVRLERSQDTDSRGRLLAEVVLEITIAKSQVLDEVELLAEWPILEEIGAADDLLAAAVSNNSDNMDVDDINLDDPYVDATLMLNHVKAFEERGDVDIDDDDAGDDQDSIAELMYGQDVIRYFEKVLRIVNGRVPTVTFKAGYETDEDAYPFQLGDAYRTTLIGDTPAEVAVLTQLNDETFRAVDTEMLKEFEEALYVAGILKRSLK